MKILLIEDKKELAKSIVNFLGKENYLIDVAHNLSDAEEKINLYEYDCAVIGLMLPDGSGLNLTTLLKRLQPNCGIIIIIAINTLADKFSWLDLGVDDYIIKPFEPTELNTRLKSVIRRKKFEESSKIILNEIAIDTDKREAKVNEILVELTRREYDILLLLISNKDRVLTKEAIVEHVWGDDANAFNALDFVYTHIKNLRKKIIEAGGKDYIYSVYGIGYKLSLK